MPPELTGKDWAQIRNDYEHTERPVEDICAEHRISPGTLRHRVRRWGWTPRRPPIPREGPPPAPAPLAAALDPSPASGGGIGTGDAFLASGGETGAGDACPACGRQIGAVDASPACGKGTEGREPACDERDMAAPSLALIPPPAAGGEADAAGAADDRPIAARLHSAVGRLLPAIEATAATLGAGRAHPREVERAARVLAALTRTLRELNSQLRQHEADEAARIESSADLDKMRQDLALRLEAIVNAREAEAAGPAA